MFKNIKFPKPLLCEVKVLSTASKKTENGRIISYPAGIKGSFKAVFSSDRQEERERWHQTGYPSQFKLITRGAPPCNLTAGDILECKGDKYYVKAVRNPGGFGHYTIIHCELRKDV